MTQATNNGWQQAILQNTRATAQLELKVDLLTNKVDKIETDISQLTNKVEKIEADVSQLKDDVKEIKTEMPEMKKELSAIREQLKGFLFIKIAVGTIALALIARLIGDYLLVH